MLILGIDTSTNNCSVGLIRNGKEVRHKEMNSLPAHSEKLIGFIDELFSGEESFSNLDAIAVSNGPGSYTGLRIGLATAKGLALPHKIPVLPVPTFKVLENIGKEQNNREAVLFIKSHRDIVYYCYTCFQDEQIELEVKHDHFSNVLTEYSDVTLFLGCGDFQVTAPKRIINIFPDGINVALLAEQFYQELLPLSRSGLEPKYFTNFIAKKWKPKI